MRRGYVRKCLLVLLLAVPVVAFAQRVQTLRAVNVRAGPDRIFPLVTFLTARTEVHVIGCTEGWRWCDIVSGRVRGWVDGTYLSGPFRNPRVPFITFSVGPYWDAHYIGRPWYASKDHWSNWGTPSFQPPPPPRS